MGKQLTTEQWAVKAIARHGDTYDYSATEYINAATKVAIRCKVHNEVFQQKPGDHAVSGAGCKKCGTIARVATIRKPTEVICENFRSRHGTLYDYANVVFITNRTKVDIRCKKHNTVFSVTPKQHMLGSGCPDCSSACITLLSFIEVAEEKFGNKFTYNHLVEPFSGSSEVTMTCCTHGEFTTTAKQFLQSAYGCKECGSDGKKAKLTRPFKKFVEDTNKIHTNLLLDESLYTNIDGVLTVKCMNHSTPYEFSRSPWNLTYRPEPRGCPVCSYIKYDTESFIEKLIPLYDNIFDFSLVEYVNSATPVKVVCKKCGYEGSKSATRILQGNSTCMACNSRSRGFKCNKPGNLYYLKVSTDSGTHVYKIGITNQTVQKRFSIKELARIEILQITAFDSGQDAYDAEQTILKKFKEFQYKGHDVLDTGNTELFTKDILGLDKKVANESTNISNRG